MFLSFPDDEVDGVLFNTSPITSHTLANGRGTPELANEKLLPPHLYGEDNLCNPSPGVAPIKVYLGRFWILGAFSFMAMYQVCVCVLLFVPCLLL